MHENAIEFTTNPTSLVYYRDFDLCVWAGF